MGGSHVWGRGSGPCTVKSNVSWVMVTWGPPVNRQTRLKTLPSRKFVGGGKNVARNQAVY